MSRIGWPASEEPARYGAQEMTAPRLPPRTEGRLPPAGEAAAVHGGAGNLSGGVAGPSSGGKMRKRA